MVRNIVRYECQSVSHEPGHCCDFILMHACHWQVVSSGRLTGSGRGQMTRKK